MKHDVRLSIATLLLGFLLVGGLGSAALVPAHAASSATTLNNVQVFVQTTNSNMTSYSLTAYNSSGYEVVSSTSNYPGFGFGTSKRNLSHHSNCEPGWIILLSNCVCIRGSISNWSSTPSNASSSKSSFHHLSRCR